MMNFRALLRNCRLQKRTTEMKRTLRIIICTFFIIEELLGMFVGYRIFVPLFFFIVAFFHVFVGWKGIVIIVSAETLDVANVASTFSFPIAIFIIIFVWCALFLVYCLHFFLVRKWKLRERCGIMLS